MRRLLLVLVLLLLPARASAGEIDVVTRAAYFQSTDQPTAAAALLAAHLADAPTDLRAQKAYIGLMHWRLGEGPFLEHQYRGWLAQSPEDPVRRAALAWTLHTVHWGKGPWCEEADALLGPLPSDPSARTRALLIRQAVNRTCEIDDPGLGDAVKQARRADPAMSGAALFDALHDEPLSRAVLARAKRSWRADPASIAAATALWRRDTEHPLLADARTLALERARALTRSDEPVVVLRAGWVLREADRPDELAAAMERLKILDPAARPRALGDPLGRRIREAGQRANPQAALDVLEALAAEVPPDGPLRAALELARQAKYELQGDEEAAYTALAAAWRADPTDPRTANEWAYAAAQAGRDLEDALGAIDAALAILDQRDFKAIDGHAFGVPEQHWEGWAKGQAATRSSYLDTKAWVLHKLGRPAEAAVPMRAALLLRATPVGHLHMAFIHEALGRDEEAVEHLLLGLESIRQPEPALAAAAEALLHHLLPTARAQWHHDGVQGLLDSRRAARAEAASSEPTGASVRPPEPPHPLVGQPFPELTLTVDGEQRTLADFPGPVVLDLWATWCGPCIKAMPHLEELARVHPDVTFLAVSLDEREEQATRFFDGAQTAFTVAWSGRGAYAVAQIRSIPSVFVLDADHTVTAYIRGYRTGDDRVDVALQALQ
mgnify:FL=1